MCQSISIHSTTVKFSVSFSFGILQHSCQALSLGHCECTLYILLQVISIKDNDSLAARLAVEVDADVMLLLSDVDGIYTMPPGTDGARFLTTYCPSSDLSSVTFGGKSRVGLGGMDSKVRVVPSQTFCARMMQ